MADFSKLDMGTLKRYKRHYKLRTKHNSNKTELAATVSKHFSSQAVLEMETISFFVYAVKNQGIDDDLWCLKQLIPPPSPPPTPFSLTRRQGAQAQAAKGMAQGPMMICCPRLFAFSCRVQSPSTTLSLAYFTFGTRRGHQYNSTDYRLGRTLRITCWNIVTGHTGHT